MRELVRMLLRRHVALMIALVLLLCLSFAMLQFAISKQRNDAYLVNISGKQRMLSQRIVSLAQNILSYELLMRESHFLREELKLALQEFMSIHKSLSKRALERPRFSFKEHSPLYEVYFGSWNLAAKVDEFLGIGDCFLHSESLEESLHLSHELMEIWEGREGLLGVLELCVLTFQLESERHLDALQEIALALLVLILLIVGAEGFLVIRPALRHRRTLEESAPQCDDDYAHQPGEKSCERVIAHHANSPADISVDSPDN